MLQHSILNGNNEHIHLANYSYSYSKMTACCMIRIHKTWESQSSHWKHWKRTKYVAPCQLTETVTGIGTVTGTVPYNIFLLIRKKVSIMRKVKWNGKMEENKKKNVPLSKCLYQFHTLIFIFLLSFLWCNVMFFIRFLRVWVVALDVFLSVLLYIQEY